MIQWDNSAEQLCTKGFNSNELFQISRDYKTENMRDRQKIW